MKTARPPGSSTKSSACRVTKRRVEGVGIVEKRICHIAVAGAIRWNVENIKEISSDLESQILKTAASYAKFTLKRKIKTIEYRSAQSIAANNSGSYGRIN